MIDGPLGVVLILIGFLVGALWASRKRVVSLKNWQSYLSNLHSPKAIVSHKDGRIFFANRSFVRLYDIDTEHGDFRMRSEQEQNAIAHMLRHRRWPTPFIDVTADIRTSFSHKVPRYARFSGLPIWCKGKHAWIVSLEPESESVYSEPFINDDNQIFRSVINSLAELVCFQDREGKVVGTNQAFDRFWKGREEEGLFFNSTEDVASRRTQQSWTTNPNGDSCLLESNQTVLRDTDNHIYGTLSISHDVTNWHMMRQVMEQEIQARHEVEQQLKKHSNLLTSIFQASVDPIGIYNNDYEFLGGNPAFAEAMGAPHDDLEGELAEEIVEPEILAQHQKMDRPVIEDGDTVKYEDLVMKRDGSMVWYEMTKTQFVDPTDETTGVLVIARDVTERKATQQQLADAIMELEELSFVDGLTKVANRRSFDEQLVKMWHSHIREGEPLSLILCDIDFFKPYNDNYGHQSGDAALRKVADVFQHVIRRPLDAVARYGGEEFAILLPNTTETGAIHVAENISLELAAANIPHEFSGVSDRLTLSQGTATIFPKTGQDYGELVSLADKALYKAKNAGRNQITSTTQELVDVS
ncbi:sensor domain-containing diguanylate cyclase [Enterovibrio nigricans]|uniref:diguanylate cyclase n=1 Tax=Enterovibrio nigricans DSM 22720 TaxID=1121868 RepID=A0A1T4TTD3_9GAMM|nr:diguanylate cyclase [Enterovibrio nigricans]SKA43735.1 PAS domain S-box-containing protein/diguanylate cyclase (GGDEF) domain-containing protein [Enterovibrio nigricans DSM 22720]